MTVTNSCAVKHTTFICVAKIANLKAFMHLAIFSDEWLRNVREQKKHFVTAAISYSTMHKLRRCFWSKKVVMA